MEIQLHGIIDGKHIELEKETGLPAGSPVIVQIQSGELSLEAQRKVIDDLCGAWADDTSLTGIFADIQRQREQTTQRDVDYDASA
jgi:hypothetical protein